MDVAVPNGTQTQKNIIQIARSANRWLLATYGGLVAVALAFMVWSAFGSVSRGSIFATNGIEEVQRDGLFAVSIIAMVTLAIAVVKFSIYRRLVYWGTGSFLATCLVFGGFIAFTVAVTIGAWLQVTSMLSTYREARLDEQVAVARLKANQIDSWSKERLIDLDLLGETLKTYWRADFSKSDLALNLDLALSQFLAGYPERIGVGIFRPDGQPILTKGVFDPSYTSTLEQQVRKAAETATPNIGAIRPGGRSKDGLSIAFAAPMPSTSGPSPERLVLVEILDPTLGIFRNFTAWPYPSATSIVGLVYREGDSWVHIVEDQPNRSADPLTLRVPVSSEGFEVASDSAKIDKAWQAVGHEQQKSFAALYSTKSLPWTVVARTSIKEAMAPAVNEMRIVWIATATITLFAGLLMLAVSTQFRLTRLLEKSS